MIQYIVERVAKVFSLDSIVLATSDLHSDDPLEQFARSLEVKCYRGSLEDVASRFHNAAMEEKWDYAVRINGDNIFVDTNLLEHMKCLALHAKFDFISNVKERTFPKGMSIEIVNTGFYGKLLPEIRENPMYFEHVTSFLYEHENRGRYHYVMNTEVPELAGVQLAMDTEEDFLRTEKIMVNFSGSHLNYNLKELSNILLERTNAK